jgi:L-ascorbate metabolism protein UlaG (beta-lactamase superfamily)
MKIIVLITVLSLSLQGHIPTPDKNLQIRYFYNSGWMIETANHAIVIDFIQHAASGITINYLQQLLRQASDKGKKPIVMITHDHNDHFDPAILELAKAFPQIEFIFGWQYKFSISASIKTLNNRDSLFTSTYKIYSHISTDDGVGFLIQIDGNSIYHAGDHALWAEQITQQFTDELKFIRSKAKQIDIAFAPAARGMFTKCAYDSVIAKGLNLTAAILKPETMALQHVGCPDKFNVYQQAYKDLRKATSIKKWIVPAKYNQQF